MNRPEAVGQRPHGPSSSGALGPIWLASIRDLQWRSRRFLLAVLATGLVFGLALMISGVANSFNVEVKNTVGALDAPFWFVPTGSLGPFTVAAPFPASDAAAIQRIPGVSAANPILVSRALTAGAVTTSDSTSASVSSEQAVNLIGVVPGGVGSPRVVEGRPLRQQDSAVVDESLGVKVGQKIALNGTRFTVRGLVDGVTYFAGQPVVFVTLRAADALTADGKALATAVLARGVPIRSASGFTALTDAQVRADLGRPTAQAAETIRLIEYLLWLVAAGIIGAIVYLSALERRGDFAVLKAVGTPSSHLFFGLVIQAVLIALGAAIVGILVEIPMSGTSQMAVRLALSNYLAVPLVAVIIGVVASIPPARRAARVDPAIAFGGGK
jgi:putative ABC transport system permease protein